MSQISPRHLSRELALKVLFSLSQNQKADPDQLFDYVKDGFYSKLKKNEIWREIFEKVLKNKEKNLSWIKEFATSFSMEKTNPIDISILEILITEIFYLKIPTPVPVAVNEAILLANEYWKDWSASFINWVIAQVNKKYGKSSK